MKEESINKRFLKHIIWCLAWGLTLAIIASLITPIINFLLAFITTATVTIRTVNWALLITWTIWYIINI